MEYDIQNAIVLLLLKFTAALVLLCVWFFFAIHAMQRTQDPIERMGWFIWLTVLAPFGICYYFFARYTKHWKEGRAGWIMKNSDKA